MKQLIIGIFIVSAITFGAFNNGNESKKAGDGSVMNNDTTKQIQTDDNKPVKQVNPAFTAVNPTIMTSVKIIVDHYLRIKNALAADNKSEASDGGKEMVQALSKIDNSFFSLEQKKLFDKEKDDLKENAEHIGKSDKIDHQRALFSIMSEDMYELIRGFGAGKILYHDHCPMYNDNKGAMWISETKDIKNPYLGAKMPTCGSVEEVIK